MPDLGRAALITAFLLLAYATIAGALAARLRRRRLALSAQNAKTQRTSPLSVLVSSECCASNNKKGPHECH